MVAVGLAHFLDPFADPFELPAVAREERLVMDPSDPTAIAVTGDPNRVMDNSSPSRTSAKRGVRFQVSGFRGRRSGKSGQEGPCHFDPP